jgi:hypothetical protein
MQQQDYEICEQLENNNNNNNKDVYIFAEQELYAMVTVCLMVYV